MAFKELTEQLEALQKSQTLQADETKKIADAAALAAAASKTPDANGSGDGKGKPKEGEGEGEGTDTGEGAGEGGKDGKNPVEEASPASANFAKSFNFTLEDGTTVEAFDGAALLKSFSDQLEQTGTRIAATEEEFSKALSTSLQIMSAQAETIASQGQMLKSLAAEVQKLGEQGRGRMSVTAVHQVAAKKETPLAKSLATMSQTDILAKSMEAMKAGRISGQDAMLVETYVNNNAQVPEHILSRVIGN